MKTIVIIPEERIKKLKEGKNLINKIENLVPVKIKINNDITLESVDPVTLLRTKSVIEAFGRGFDLDDAMNLLDEKYILEIIKINQFTNSRKRQKILKGRIIGSKGKTKKFIEKICDVKITIYGKTISIIGVEENIKVAKEGIEMLLNGAEHNSVYRFLEGK